MVRSKDKGKGKELVISPISGRSLLHAPVLLLLYSVMCRDGYALLSELLLLFLQNCKTGHLRLRKARCIFRMAFSSFRAM